MKIIDGIKVLGTIGEATRENVPPGTIFIFKDPDHQSPLWHVERSFGGKIAEVFLFDDALLIARLFSNEDLLKMLRKYDNLPENLKKFAEFLTETDFVEKPMTNDEKFKDASIRS